MALNERPRISVVIPTYQRRESLRRALMTLATQQIPADMYEVVVAIDGSEDGTKELIGQLDVPYALRSLWQPNRGRAAACNAGARAAHGDVIVLLDDDMEATPGLLAAHLQAHNGASNLGVIGAIALVCSRASNPYVRHFAARWEQKMALLADAGHVFRMIDFCTGNFSIRREWITKTGGFDESFQVYGHEDRELFLRLREAGVAVRFSSDALTRHHYNRPFAALAQDTVGRGRTAVLLADKHPSLADSDPSELGDLLPLRRLVNGRLRPRIVRDSLLELAERLPRVPIWIAVFTQWWEERLPGPPLRYYEWTVQFYYWLGVRAALREKSSAGSASTAERRYS